MIHALDRWNKEMKKHKGIGLNHSERGGAGIKLLLVLLALFLIGHAGYNYIPVAYAGTDLKQEMQAAVLQGMAVVRGEDPVVNVRKRILSVVSKSGAPEARVEVKALNQLVQAHVSYTKKVNLLPFGLYQYDYVFDHTATPSGLLFDQ